MDGPLFARPNDYAPRGPQGKVDEDGELWGDHILIPGF
jgi:hypothetical protein